MKPTNIIISLFCIMLCLLGWFKLVSDNNTEKNEYEEHITLAEEYMDEGLYQRAIKEYMFAFDMKKEHEVAQEIVEAYVLRFEEATEETYAVFVSDLEKILKVFPGDENFAILLAELYLMEGDNKQAFNCLRNAEANGAEGNELQALLRRTRYAYELRYNEYNSAKATTGTSYVVLKDGLWGLYDVNNGTVWGCKYSYISQLNEDGVVLVTTREDSRLIDGTGMVLGIFKDIIVDAGVYRDGLVPASADGVTYSYYDEFAKKEFGGFEVAGTFVNGKAAVKKDGKWFLIDTDGEKLDSSYAEIVLNTNGEYISGSYVLAASKPGEYRIYDDDMESVAKLTGYEKVDILTEDGIIAVCKDGKWGFVNVSGKEIIEPQYEAARSFSNGLAAVCKDGKWGFIDKDNNIVIECVFIDAGYFNTEGTVMVCTKVEDVEVPTADNNESSDSNDETSETPPTDEKEYIQVESWFLLKLENGIVAD